LKQAECYNELLWMKLKGDDFLVSVIPTLEEIAGVERVPVSF